ncbi:hypothetical protein [Desulfurococcus amylolyticus]|uniref:hypothetical protein n=1 Tax=Desulfurococcus amylolyticus TaxID=94694 RepID=UPI0005B1DDDA|nr:hypothetical protein [Desulfurococcus amylolyticus]
MSIEVKISLPGLAGIILIIASITVGIYVFQMDSSLTYTWIVPLNSVQVIHLYFKQNIGLALVDVGKGSNYITVSSGAASTLTLLPASSSYAVITARGVSIYVETVNAIGTLIIVVAAWIAVRRRSGLKLAIIMTVLSMLAASNALAQIFYLNTGLGSGYSVNERGFSIPFSQLEPVVLGNETYRYSYVLRDTVNGVALVNLSIQVRDQYIPLIIVRAYNNQGSIDIPLSTSIPSGGPITYSAASYLSSGNLTIYVLSMGQLENTTLNYYKVEFQRISDSPPILVTLLPLITLVASFASCILLLRITMLKQ